jgi:fatty-acyl-CoA synthase
MLGTLRDHFASTVSKWPDGKAVICGERTYTWRELDRAANRLAHLLVRSGARKGDGVGLLVTNRVEFAIGFFACQKLGAISSCLNYRLSAAAIGYAVQQENLKALLFDAEFSAIASEIVTRAPACRLICVGSPVPPAAVSFEECAAMPESEPPRADISERDLCNVIHTSGTTGRPKGAAFTHEGQIITGVQYCLEMGLDRGHVGMTLAPVVIGAATNFFVAYAVIGACQVMSGGYQATKALGLIARHRVTEVFAVPTQLYQLVAAKAELAADLDTSSLRLFRSGGSPLSKASLHRVREAFHCEILNTYGTTESCTAITACHTGLDPEDKWESIGKSSYFQEVRVVALKEGLQTAPDEWIAIPGEGQLINRGPQAARDYYCTPSEQLRAREGWQYTRDVVWVDDDGYIYVVDRIDNVIISGGENIYPQEIEFFLSKHPRIADVAVCGVPDEQWGQVIKALIVRCDPSLSAEEVDRYCLQSNELARHKRPRVFQFVDSLPRNVLGKINRTALR